MGLFDTIKINWVYLPKLGIISQLGIEMEGIAELQTKSLYSLLDNYTIDMNEKGQLVLLDSVGDRVYINTSIDAYAIVHSVVSSYWIEYRIKVRKGKVKIRISNLYETDS